MPRQRREVLGDFRLHQLGMRQQRRHVVRHRGFAAGMKPEQTYYFSANVEDAGELEAAKRAAADLLIHDVHAEDLVLLKGSRGMRTETMLRMW